MQIDVPQLGVIDFPDEMSPQDVVSTIRTKLIPQYRQSQGGVPLVDGEPKMPFGGNTMPGYAPQAPVTSGMGNPALAALGVTQAGPIVAQGLPHGLLRGTVEQVNAQNAAMAVPFGMGFEALHGLQGVSPLIKKAAVGAAGLAMSAGPLGIITPGVNIAGHQLVNPSGATSAEQHEAIPAALPALIPAAIPVAKFGSEMLGDLVQTGYRGRGINNPFATLRPRDANVGLGANAGSIFPSSGAGVPSTPTPISDDSRQAATPSIPEGFKKGLASVPDTQLMQRYQAAVDASRGLIAEGKHQEAMNLGTMAQFMREEMQNRRQAAVQIVVQSQQNIGVQNDNEGRIQSEAGGRTQPQVQENRQEGGQAVVEGQVQKAPQEQIPGYDAGTVRPAVGSNVQGNRGEGVGTSRVSIINKVKSGVQLSHDDLAFLYQMPFESSKELMQQVNRNATTLLPESVPNRLSIQNAQRAWDARDLMKQQQNQGLPQETVEQRNARMLQESQAVQKAVQTKKMLANAPLVSAESQAISGVQKKQLAALGNDLGVKLPKGAKWTKLQDYEAADLLEQVRNVPDKDPLTVATKKALTERLQKIQAGDSFAKLGQQAEANRASRAERSKGEVGALFPDSERGKTIDADLPLPKTATEVEQLKQTFAANKDAIIKVKANLMFYDTPENKQKLTDLMAHQQRIATALSDAVNKITNTSKAALERDKSIDVSSSVQTTDKTPIGFQEKNGNTRLIVHPSTKEPGKWQVSGFAKDADGRVTAQGDSVFPTKDAAVASVPKDKFVPEVAKKRTSESGAVNPQGSNEERFGISAKASIEMGRDIEPGEGSSPEELVHRGRELLASGVDPEKALKQALKNKNPLSDAISVTRAHGEALYKAASEAADKHGIDSPEYKAAAKADSEWARKTQPLRTEAGEAMRAIQGTTDIDTGTFHGVQRAFTELMASKGQDIEMTPAQKEFAKKTTDEVKAAEERIKHASLLVFKQLHEQAEAPKPQQTKVLPPTPLYKSRPGERGAVEHDLRDPVAKRAETLRVWDHVKANYLDKGAQDFDDVVNGTATDLGMTPDEVRKQLTASAKTKQLTDEMYMAMDAKRKAKQSIDFWLRDQLVPMWARAFRMIPRVFFLDKIAGHGTVGMITHAGINMFDPAAWKTYFPSFMKQYKLAWSSVNHEAWVQDQLRKPNFAMWKRAGLKHDPFTYPDDYQNASIKAFMGKLNLLIGNYGFDALKDFRINRANQIWDAAPASLKFTEDGRTNLKYARMIADGVNYASGVVATKLPEGLQEALTYGMFAPKLEFSRWAFALGDPIKAGTVIPKWVKGTATPEEVAFLKSEIAQKARIVGTFASLLALNQAYLSYTDSKQKINWNNPKQSDFLAFKVAGKNVGVISAFLGELRLFAKMIHAMNEAQKTYANGKPVFNQTSRQHQVGDALMDYARGKASPMAGFGMDVGFQATATKDVVPWSKDVPGNHQHKETGGEYAANTFLPIPFEEAVKAVWEEQGMDKGQQNVWMKILQSAGTPLEVAGAVGYARGPMAGLIAGGATAAAEALLGTKSVAISVNAGLTGARIAPDYSLEPQTGKQNSPPAFKPPTLGRGFKKYSENDIIQRNGKNYTVTGFDNDGQPLVEEV